MPCCGRYGLTCHWLIPLLTGFTHSRRHDVLQKETIREGSPALHRIPHTRSLPGPGSVQGGRMGRAACPVPSGCSHWLPSAHGIRAAGTGKVRAQRGSAGLKERSTTVTQLPRTVAL